MISEVVNSVFITYLATEYSSTSNPQQRPSRSLGGSVEEEDRQKQSRAQQRRVLAVSAVVTSINLLDRITGVGSVAHGLVEKFLHLPKVVFAALFYVAALYYDCRAAVQRSPSGGLLHPQQSSPLQFRQDFLPRVTKAFCRILPIYPIGAVLISFGFLFVINLFELLHIPTDILNVPIYYGTLYGPFSYIYFTVKRSVILDHQNTIPITTNPPRRLGSV